MGHNRFIAECTSYNLKQMLERKKVKSWLKSVSAFANTEGGSLFFGITDEHFVVGLPNPQADADFISETYQQSHQSRYHRARGWETIWQMAS